MFEQEKQVMREKLEEELKMAEKKFELEREVKRGFSKLPKVKLTPFKGSAVDWVRFENMFLSQVHNKDFSDEEKFTFLLELVTPKIRDQIGNLKPGTLGYNTAWQRLKREYGETKHIINSHMSQIVNLPLTKGTSVEKGQEFYDKLTRSYDALETLGESEMLKGFVLTTLNKLPHIKPDIVRTDDSWEEWGMKDLIDNIHK